MHSNKTSALLALACSLMITTSARAEAPKVEFPQASPACTLKQRVGLTDIEVDYSRPSVKGRKIFGGIVPYGKVWRTGANQATKIIFSTPVTLDGHEVAAGTYGLFTIPGEDEWTIILNKVSDQWGAYKYDEKDDVLRFTVKPLAIDRPIDTMVIEFNRITDDSSNINIVWDETVAQMQLKTNLVATLVPQIEAVMSSDDAKKPYFQAALFYYNHDQDLQKAHKWIDAALAEKETHYMLFVKAEILAKLNDKQGAAAAAKHSMELAEKANDDSYVRMDKDLLKSLE